MSRRKIESGDGNMSRRDGTPAGRYCSSAAVRWLTYHRKRGRTFPSNFIRVHNLFLFDMDTLPFVRPTLASVHADCLRGSRFE